MQRAFLARTSILALIVATTAGGCAGGGGGSPAMSPPPPPAVSPPPPSPPPPPPPVSYPSSSSSEYLKSWSTADSKAITAWQNGATGQSILVAVIDSGFDSTDPELAGRISPASTDIVSSRDQLFDPADTHGSEVAAIVAANFNGSKSVGIAFNATILGIRSDEASGSGQFNSNDVVNAIDYAIARGAKVISLSLGGPTPSVASTRAALKRATDAGIIVVAAAGNDNAADPQYPAFLATDASISNSIIIAVGAHDRNDNFASFSNQAGSAQNFYLTAPGVNVVVPDFGAPGPTDPMFQICAPDGTCQVAGTSYSTPAVAAAIALLREAFPSLTPQQIVQLLLMSADDAGPAGVDSTWGHGRLDINQAFQPVGTVSAPLVAGGPDIPLNTPMGVTGAAFGDGIVNSLRSLVAVGFDSFGRSFRVDLGANWSTTSPDLTQAVPMIWASTIEPGQFSASLGTIPNEVVRLGAERQDPSTFAVASFRFESAISKSMTATFAANAEALAPATPIGATGHLAFAGSATAFAITQRLGNNFSLSLDTQGSDRSLGRVFGESHRRAYALRLDGTMRRFSSALMLGTVTERGAMLGLAWSDRIATAPDGLTSFLGVASTFDATSRLHIGAEAEIGRTTTTGGRWIDVTEPLITSAFALSASFDLGTSRLRSGTLQTTSRLTLAVRQPLRVESGQVSVQLPNGNEWGRSSLTYVTHSFDPEPSGREVDYELGYEVWNADLFCARAALSYEVSPGHIASAAPQIIGTVGFRYRF
jgi:Subtilase family